MSRRTTFSLVLLAALSGCGDTTGGVDNQDLSGVLPGDMAARPPSDLSGTPADLAGSGDLSGGGADESGLSDLATSGDEGARPDLTPLPPDLTPPPDLTLPPCQTRCPQGCCDGDTCLPANPNLGCAKNGGACVPCNRDTADSCANGACGCGGGPPCANGLQCVGGKCQCTARTCAGCCADAMTCVQNVSSAQCGQGGSACVDCGATGNQCLNGACSCNGQAACGAHALCDKQKGCTCDNQSCGTNGMCTVISLMACGQPGGGCAMCDPRKADHCDANSGTCRCGANPACAFGTYCDLKGMAPQCLCDPTPMTGCPGCCSLDKLTCVMNQSDVNCGKNGSTCANCQMVGQACIQNQGVCAGCAQMCNGCCNGNTCVPGANQNGMTGCGAGGMACAMCGSGADSCLGGACSCGNLGKPCSQGNECVTGMCVCDAKSCPMGCCSQGACQNLSALNCGVAGGACVACDAAVADTCLIGVCSCGQSGAPCSAGSRCVKGACVCDAQSCAMGCCAGNVCNGIAFPGACAAPGGVCGLCDPKTTDTCDPNGNCLCGTGPACGAGLHCNKGLCVCDTNPCATCLTAAQSHSYVGCDYWPTVTTNPVWSIFDFAVAVANPQMVAATVTVSGPNNFATNATVQPGQLAKIYLPWVADLKGPDQSCLGTVTPLTATVRHNGGAYHLTASLPVSVYQFSAIEYKGAGGPNGKSWAACPGSAQCGGLLGCYSFTNDASILLPSTAMTGTYRIAALHAEGNGIGHIVAITGTAANTAVTFKLSATGSIVAGGGIPATAAGGTLMFNVNAGDVVQLMTGSAAAQDLSGSIMSASNPVQVITGVQCINNPLGVSACDHIESTNMPAETLGKQYVVTVPTGPNGVPVGHTVKIYGNWDKTNLVYDPAVNGAPAVINAGQVVTLDPITADFTVVGDQSFAVGSFQWGAAKVDPNNGGSNQQGDPSSTMIVPFEQYRKDYIFLAPSDYNVNYADIVVPMGSTVTLDGVQQAGMPVAVGKSGLGTLRVKLGAGNLGAHTLTGTQAVGLQVMGYGSYTSYQYPGGLDLNLISGKPVDAP